MKNGEIELPPAVTATCGCVCRVVVGRNYPEVFVVKVCKRHKAYHEELLGKKELEVRDLMAHPRKTPPKEGSRKAAAKQPLRLAKTESKKKK